MEEKNGYTQESVEANDNLSGENGTDNRKPNKKHVSITKVVIGILVFLNIVMLAAAISLSASVSSMKEKNASIKSENQSLSSKVSSLQDQNHSLRTKNDSLTRDNISLKATNDSLASQNDDLKNGAAAQLVQIKNSFEAGKWQDVIDKAKALHQKYNGSSEDKEAQNLANQAQAKLDAAAQAKAAEEAKGYETGITYDQLARTPDDYVGKKVKFSGKVVQVVEGSDSVDIRLAVNDDYDTIVYAEYAKSTVSSRVLEDDEITIYGTSVGTISYQSTLGGTITIPGVYVDKIDQ